MDNQINFLRSRHHSLFKGRRNRRQNQTVMAMAIALGAGCRNCVLGQAEAALGATREDFLETIAVVISMRGTTGVAESLRVIQLLDELGKL